jgi:hypothetical protein
MQDVGVVYLYRFAEGEGPVRRFLESYSNHPAGLEHDLNIVFKGFPDQGSLARARALFSNTPINSIEHEDVGYDIGSYRWAANIASNRRLIFLNTFSQILVDRWLAHFDRALSLPGVGLVGATGSWLANSGTYEAGVKYLLRKAWGGVDHSPQRAQGIWKRRLGFYLRTPFEYLFKLYEYGRYPNPHIRTNAFMMERDCFLSLDGAQFETKRAAHKFESGRQSMTKQILQRNLAPVVVDRNGKVYGISEWKSSSTFWINEQTNLIIADNRTSDYAQADQGLRDKLENLAWVRPWDWYGKPRRPSGLA